MAEGIGEGNEANVYNVNLESEAAGGDLGRGL
jgi:hypothetical protein